MTLSSRSLEPDDLWWRTQAEFDSRKGGYSALDVRSAIVRADGAVSTVAWVIRGVVEGEKVEERSWTYRNVEFAVRQLPVDRFEELVSSAWIAGRWFGEEIALDAGREGRLRPLGLTSALAGRPGVAFRRRHATGAELPSEPVATFELPYSPHINDAIGATLGIRNWAEGRDTRWPSGWVVLPETRAWIDRAGLDEDRLELLVRRSQGWDRHLRLKGHVSGGGEAVTLDELVAADGLVRARIPSAADTFELVLLDEDDNVLTCHRETSRFGTREDLAILGTRAGSRGEVLDLVAGGESDRVEFKPFVDPDERRQRKKYDELARTVSAFANSRGGDLLIGVQDDAVIGGLSAAARAWAGDEFEPAIDAYERRLRSDMQREIHPTPTFEFSVVAFGDEHVLRVSVEPADDTPVLYRGDTFVRRGSTSRKATRGELRDLCQTEPEATGWRRIGLG